MINIFYHPRFYDYITPFTDSMMQRLVQRSINTASTSSSDVVLILIIHPHRSAHSAASSKPDQNANKDLQWLVQSKRHGFPPAARHHENNLQPRLPASLHL